MHLKYAIAWIFSFLFLTATLLAEKMELEFKSGETKEVQVIVFQKGWLMYADTEGALHTIQEHKLSEESQNKVRLYRPQPNLVKEWMGNLLEEPAEFPPTPPRGWQLVGWDDADRSFIQNLNQQDYGNSWTDCVPNSLINSLKWWDNRKLLPFKKKRDYEDQVDWMHSELAMLSSTGMNSGTRLSKLAHGTARFFQKNLTRPFLFPFFEIKDITPGKLCFYTQNNTAACLTLSVYYAGNYKAEHCVTLVSADLDGRIKFNTWGHKFSGKLIPIPGKPHSYTIELFNQNELPNHFLSYDMSFAIQHSRRGSLNICLPYKRLQVGDTWTPPPTSLVYSADQYKATPKKHHHVIVEWDTCTKDGFKKKRPFTSTWTSSSGKTMDASLVGSTDHAYIFRKGKKQFKLSRHELNFESYIRAELWKSNIGESFQLPACVLHYRLKHPGRANTETLVKVYYDGDGIAEAKLPHIQKAFSYNHQTKTLSTRSLINEGYHFSTVLEDTPSPFVMPPDQCLELCNCDQANRNEFPSRSTRIKPFRRNQYHHANTSAPAVTRLLYLINGSPVHTDQGTTKYIYTFNQGVPSQSGSLNIPLDVAHHWGVLPTKYAWSTEDKKHSSFELIKITEPSIEF
ncbi:hypothetical protein [Rubritalea marina]|uniref:hypothetical protein n=1 Tax=Rubritalea marina TaxID=361055 RepID=UPI000368602B|nr:hypothetical protein [Rubritalea marina]